MDFLLHVNCVHMQFSLAMSVMVMKLKALMDVMMEQLVACVRWMQRVKTTVSSEWLFFWDQCFTSMVAVGFVFVRTAWLCSMHQCWLRFSH